MKVRKIEEIYQLYKIKKNIHEWNSHLETFKHP